jgi:hypothetical protein
MSTSRIVSIDIPEILKIWIWTFYSVDCICVCVNSEANALFSIAEHHCLQILKSKRSHHVLLPVGRVAESIEGRFGMETADQNTPLVF